MRRALGVVVLMFVLLGMGALPALAETTGRGRMMRPFNLTGQVNSVSVANKTLTVTVLTGNAIIKPIAGQQVTLHTDARTRFLPRGTTLGSITPESTVAALGITASGIYTASQITVLAKPRTFDLVGTVAGVNPVSKVISVQVVSGSALVKPFIGKAPLALATDSATRFAPTGTNLGNIGVGDKITASGRYTNSTFLATRVTIVPRPTNFDLAGRVTAVITETGTISVQVTSGSTLVRPYIGHDPLALVTDGATRFSPDGVALEDIGVGDQITASGRYTNSTFLAARVTVVPLPTHFALAGRVTAVVTETGTISVQVTSGSFLVRPYIGHNPLALVTISTTRFSPAGISLGKILVGDQLEASGRYTNSAFVASQVTVQRRRFELTGRVTGVDTAALTLTVLVSGNVEEYGARPSPSREVTITTDANTLFYRVTDHGASRPVTITFADIQISDTVRAVGQILPGDVRLAQRVDVVMPAPVEFDLAGRVTAVITETSVISVQVLSGNAPVRPYIGHGPLLLTVTPETTFSPDGTNLANIEVGATIVANGVVSDTAFIAQRVFVMRHH